MFGGQLREVRHEHVHGGHLAKAVIGALTIHGGPVDCYDDLLQSTDDVAVAADCARVKEDLRSLCRAAHSYQARHGDEASLVGFLERTRVEPADALTEVVPIVVELRDGGPVSELSQTLETATSGAGVERVVCVVLTVRWAACRRSIAVTSLARSR